MRWIPIDRSLDPVITALEKENDRLRAENTYLRKKMIGPDSLIEQGEDNLLTRIDDHMTLHLAAKSAIKMTPFGVRVNARSYEPDGGRMEWGVFVDANNLTGPRSDRVRFLGHVAVQAVKEIGTLYDIEARGDNDARARVLVD